MKQEAKVCVFDNLTTGTVSNIKPWLHHPNFTFIKGDLLNPTDLKKLSHNNYQLVFHLAANPEVRTSSTHPNIHFQQNIQATQNLVETLRKTSNISTFIFASTSTVYGEATKIPTPEDYSPLKPISIYGATKLACEALTTDYAHTYGFKTIIYRIANAVGPRNHHNVIHDFIQKLNKNPNQLEILGDGNQTKSYIHINDCIQAMLTGLEKSTEQIEVFNVGSEDQINVIDIAHITIQEMKLENVKLSFNGGVEDGRGWKGDVKNMLLDITKLKSLGWKPELNSAQAVQKATRNTLKQCYKPVSYLKGSMKSSWKANPSILLA